MVLHQHCFSDIWNNTFISTKESIRNVETDFSPFLNIDHSGIINNQPISSKLKLSLKISVQAIKCLDSWCRFILNVESYTNAASNSDYFSCLTTRIESFPFKEKWTNILRQDFNNGVRLQTLIYQNVLHFANSNASNPFFRHFFHHSSINLKESIFDTDSCKTQAIIQ